MVYKLCRRSRLSQHGTLTFYMQDFITTISDCFKRCNQNCFASNPPDLLILTKTTTNCISNWIFQMTFGCYPGNFKILQLSKLTPEYVM